MTFKYNTREFIKEMECRPCLWNVNIPEYNDKGCRESAWLQIGEIMYDEWDDLNLDEKAERVKDLQKKWKGLRDYHTRVKNKKYPKKYVPELKLLTGRKRPYLDMLSFLSAKKKPNQGTQHQHPAETNDEPATVKPLVVSSYKKANLASTRKAALSTPTVFQPPPTQLQLPPTQLQPAPTQESTRLQPNDPDENFLFSILPDMKSMNSAQNFEFRFKVMKLIMDMKYKQQMTPTYQLYDNRTYLMQEQDTAVDPISNESAVSSPEDRKILLNDSE